MEETKNNGTEIKAPDTETADLIELSGSVLAETRQSITHKSTVRIPIGNLSSLGVGVAGLVPTFMEVTSKSELNVSGLYSLANADVGDVLKKASEGKFWGSLKTKNGKSKMLKLQEAAPITQVTTASAEFINPATVMMAASLMSIEMKLDNIEKMQRQIYSFLQIEKESEIEADVEMPMSILNKYKNNWENEHFRFSSHKLTMDIQRTARKNMLSAQKDVEETLQKSKKLFTPPKNVKTVKDDYDRKLKYYRLSVYIFSLASMLEVMLSGNFSEAYISGVKKEIEECSQKYRSVFEDCSQYIEKLSKKSLAPNVVKGVGIAGESVGKLIGAVPIISRGPVDEFLQEQGEKIKDSGEDIAQKPVNEFAALSSPETGAFVENLENMNHVYNHTTGICFDKDNIYLLNEEN